MVIWYLEGVLTNSSYQSLTCHRKQKSGRRYKWCTAGEEACVFLCSIWWTVSVVLTVDLLCVSRDGCSHGDGGSDPEGSAEWAEWRGDTAGNGQVPICLFGQGLIELLYSAVHILVFMWPVMVFLQGLWPKKRSLCVISQWLCIMEQI